ncbi:MAG: Ig-like domain-containing protein, partial [Chloroflexi bacterium]|nr:Ig-like domain-containing protein [Chloroflexota bacterium]
QVRFSWDIPQWSGGETKWYDVAVTLPNGNRFSERRHRDLRSRTYRGKWQPASEARIAVKALYDLPNGDRVTSAAREAQCVVPGTPNSAPAVSSAIADATIVNESGTHEVTLTGVFSDADNDALTITAGSSDDTVATATVAADGSTLTVAAKSRGTATITVTAADGKGGTVEDVFTVTVKSAPAVAAAIADVSGLEVDASHEVSMSGVFSDADNDALTITAASSDGARATVSVAADYSSLTVTGVAEGGASVTVTARDADGNTVDDAFDVTVNAAQQQQLNNPPTVSGAIADATIKNESGTHQVTLTGVFSDADNDDLTVTAASSAETVATATVSADQSALTVAAKSRGTATITVAAADGKGGTVEDTFTVTVKSAPVVASAIADVSGLEAGSTRDVSLTGVFSDADNDALTITAASSDGAKATVSVAADYASLTVAGVAEGSATVTVTAQDSDGNTVDDAFAVTVNAAQQQPANNAPAVASAIADATLVSESGTHQVALAGVFSDADNDDLTVTASSSAETVAAVSVASDRSALTVSAKSRGTATITVTAADGKGGTVDDVFTVTVKSAPVVAAAIADVSELEVDASHQVAMSGVFSDADGDAVTVTQASSSDSGKVAVVSAIEGAAAAITAVTVTGKSEGTATVTVTAQDSDGNTVSDAFDVTVPAAAVQLQRTQSSDATLSALTLSGYTVNGDPIPAFGLRPAFASGTAEYAASAPQFTARVSVTATATAPGATIQVDGQTVASGAPSQLIRLVDNQAKRIAVTVTAAGGTTRETYTGMATPHPRADPRPASVSP